MIPAVAEQIDELKRLCLHYGVQRLSLFGSAASETRHQDAGDLDFVVEFNVRALASYADAYFGLLEALEGLLAMPIDLVVESAIQNPYFLQSVEQTRVPIYEA